MMKYYASVSFGKDSLAMLLMLIEKGMPLDEVVFYDSGMEFQAIYNTRDRVLPILKKHGIKYTEVKSANSFLYDMLERPVTKRDGSHQCGYSWCGGVCRWETRKKLNALKKLTKDGFDYVGIAFDELDRLEKEKRPNRLFFLVDEKITEAEALQYCYDRGFTWEEEGVRLYDILDRVSCWCCRNKNLKELRNIYQHLPRYWKQLKDLQNKTDLPFYRRTGETITDLEKRFKPK